MLTDSSGCATLSSGRDVSDFTDCPTFFIGFTSYKIFVPSAEFATFSVASQMVLFLSRKYVVQDSQLFFHHYQARHEGVDNCATVLPGNETLHRALWPHKGNKVIPLLFADFEHIFHPICEATVKIENQPKLGVILCGSVGIVLCNFLITEVLCV